MTKTSAVEITFCVNSTRFDENYTPADTTRATTNFANLARGESRKANLQKTLAMIDRRFNALASWDNPKAERYSLDLEILSVGLHLGDAAPLQAFPLIEILNTKITDHKTGRKIAGMVGNSFSSYLRDYDFSIVLPQHMKRNPGSSGPADFGQLHGTLFKHFLRSAAYRERFAKNPVICLSASTSRTYRLNGNAHPILGVEYAQDEGSLTDRYFALMGCEVRFFMPKGSVAPLAFYCCGDLLADYSDLELISAIATMESFQRIYRPEIYNANAAAGQIYRPCLGHEDYSLTQIAYDRVERSQLAKAQADVAAEQLMIPYHHILAQFCAAFAK